MNIKFKRKDDDLVVYLYMEVIEVSEDELQAWPRMGGEYMTIKKEECDYIYVEGELIHEG